MFELTDAEVIERFLHYSQKVGGDFRSNIQSLKRWDTELTARGLTDEDVRNWEKAKRWDLSPTQLKTLGFK